MRIFGNVERKKYAKKDACKMQTSFFDFDKLACKLILRASLFIIVFHNFFFNQVNFTVSNWSTIFNSF